MPTAAAACAVQLPADGFCLREDVPEVLRCTAGIPALSGGDAAAILRCFLMDRSGAIGAAEFERCWRSLQALSTGGAAPAARRATPAQRQAAKAQQTAPLASQVSAGRGLRVSPLPCCGSARGMNSHQEGGGHASCRRRSAAVVTQCCRPDPPPPCFLHPPRAARHGIAGGGLPARRRAAAAAAAWRRPQRTIPATVRHRRDQGRRGPVSGVVLRNAPVARPRPSCRCPTPQCARPPARLPSAPRSSCQVGCATAGLQGFDWWNP